MKINRRTGSIIKIHIRNFVTYEEVICHPGPNLNVIIGPNGTGKSTIIAAIILGLGGTPKTIGRGSKIGEYVRNGCTEATIHIELLGNNDKDTYVITRTFNINNQTKWYINEELSSEQDIKMLNKNLNIQVNNLCQFLPQDRVQDFAKLNKKELLTNTQVAIGRQDLLGKQEELIKMEKQVAVLAKDVDKITQQLEQVESDMLRLEGRVKNYKDRKVFLEDVDHIKRKLSWNKYENLNKRMMEVSQDLKKATDIVEMKKKKLLPVQKEIQNLNSKLIEIQQALKNSNRIIQNKEIEAVNITEEIENLQTKQRECYCEMNIKMKAIEQSTAEIQQMQQKIDKLINDERDYIQQHGDDDTIRKKIQNFTTELNKFNQIIEDLDQKRIDISKELRRHQDKETYVKGKIQDLQNVKEKRVELLRRTDPDAYRGVLWLRENKHLFRSNVYEPMMIELDVCKKEHSKYLESIIPKRDKVAFTCESYEDMNVLIQRLREDMGLSINALHSGPDHPALSTYRAPIPIEQIRQFGFYAYVKDLVKGPEAIMKFLCRMYKIHCIPIGDDKTFDMSEKIPNEFKLFFSTQHRFHRSVSRYTNATSVKISLIVSDGTLSIFINQNEINQLHNELTRSKQEVQEYKTKIDKIDSNQTKIKDLRTKQLEEQRILLKIREDIKTIRTRLKSNKSNLQNYIKSILSEDDLKKQYREKFTDLLNDYADKFVSLRSTLKNLSQSLKKKVNINIEINIVRQEINVLENENQNLREEYDRAKKNCEKVDTFYKNLKKEFEDALKNAKELSDNFTPKDRGFKKFETKFNSLPKSEEDLLQLMEELQIKIRLMTTADENEIREYENGLANINKFQEQREEKQPVINSIREKQKIIYRDWIDPLEALVKEINKNFSQYFESMGCAGEVEIHKENGVAGIADYGLVIRVTYRDEDPLQELNRYIQSGGERAVATAVFMLSLQDLTTAPFRCVDEINQGMDVQNERRIFEILVQATCKTETCQYFLVTPKLIPDLKFGNNMKIHIVHNAQFINVNKDIDVKKILEKFEKKKLN